MLVSDCCYLVWPFMIRTHESAMMMRNKQTILLSHHITRHAAASSSSGSWTTFFSFFSFLGSCVGGGTGLAVASASRARTDSLKAEKREQEIKIDGVLVSSDHL